MANRRLSSPFLLLVLFLISISAVRSRYVLPSDPVSDGLYPPLGHGSPLYFPLLASSDSCDETYGFMPCTSTWIGNLFLILVYGYLMYMAATFLSTGSEMLLEIMGPGLIGGLVLPMLGALPDAMLILVSGLSGSTETAQSQVSIGMGLLAGSTVMLLTVVWGSCVLVGKCDLDGSGAVDKVDTKGFSLTGSGVTTDSYTSYAARIMIISVIPFVVVQLLQLINSTSGRHVAVLIALILSLVLLISYCLYQVFQPWIQRRRLAYAKHRQVIFGFLIHVKKHALGRLMTDDGKVDTEIVDRLFKTIDENDDGYLTVSELKAFLVGMRFEEIDLDCGEAVDKIMADFDTTNDSLLSKEEFRKGIEKWVKHAVHSGEGSSLRNFGTMKFIVDARQQAKEEHEQLLGADPSDEVVEGVENAKMTSLKAVGFMVLGTVIAAAFADPLVDAVDNFSDATGIPTFFISFIALPLATNASEAVSAIIFASRKKQRTSSLTFSELYGAATMNNLLCLAVFLALVYIRGLTWDFTSEVLIIVIVCIVMGSFASFRTTFPLWTTSVAFILYPFSLALVYVLDYVVGWS
ncbi:sodium/calcium exchanger NCL-like [Rhodamnia argentea]|uniref:Sodium/calcium exchanger NCL-like n=1 Tax=Rhodamnia argentea TaxID=178133 RepID=A0A8B8QR72_9MYRT|nr:sodium/calcium exchanger NCL-like [Rhodamnia argentea]